MKWMKLQDKVELVGDCWLWQGQINWAGYGLHVWKEDGKVRGQGAHRYIYELLVGEVPEGLELDHQCENKHCVNPMHLIPETKRYNILRGGSPPAQNARKTHCPNGHLYTKIKYQRYCRECHTISERIKRRERANV